MLKPVVTIKAMVKEKSLMEGLKIAVINDVHVGKSLRHQDKVRAASESIMEMFESFLKTFLQITSLISLLTWGI